MYLGYQNGKIKFYTEKRDFITKSLFVLIIAIVVMLRRIKIMRDEFLNIMKSNTAYIAKYNEYTKDIQMKAKKLIYEFNSTAPDEGERRTEILKNLFENNNLNVCIEPPFFVTMALIYILKDLLL